MGLENNAIASPKKRNQTMTCLVKSFLLSVELFMVYFIFGLASLSAQSVLPSAFSIAGCRPGEGYPNHEAAFIVVIHDPAVGRPIDPYYNRVIQRVVSIWDRDEGDILIEGHRDSSDRVGVEGVWVATAVQLLVSRGIPASKIWTRSAGDGMPMISGATGSDVIQNRRIVIRPLGWGQECRSQYIRALIGWIRLNCTTTDVSRNNSSCEQSWARLLEITAPMIVPRDQRNR